MLLRIDDRSNTSHRKFVTTSHTASSKLQIGKGLHTASSTFCSPGNRTNLQEFVQRTKWRTGPPHKTERILGTSGRHVPRYILARNIE